MSFLALGVESTDDEKDDNLFSHSRNFNAIIAEKEQKRLAKAEKLKAKTTKSEQSRSGKRKSDEFNSGQILNRSPVKRRTVAPNISSRPETPKLDVAVSITSTGDNSSNFTTASNDSKSRESPLRTVGLQESAVSGSGKAYMTAAILLSDSPVSSDDITSPQKKHKNAAPPDLDDDVSDDEFAEIARRARQRERDRNLERGNLTKSVSPMNNAASLSRPGVEASDPKVEIFLTSRLANTAPLRVFLKLSQQLGMVKNAWCVRQNFDPSFDISRIYLTHRDRKIYDMSTCRSLGLTVNRYGKLVMQGAEDKDGVDKVHLEAVTDELLEHLRVQRAAEILQQAELDECEEATAPEPVQEQLIRVIIRARDRADIKLKVRPTTTVARIVNSYKKKSDIEETQAVSLELDGEQLHLEHEVHQTDIGDLDILQAHIR